MALFLLDLSRKGVAVMGSKVHGFIEGTAKVSRILIGNYSDPNVWIISLMDRQDMRGGADCVGEVRTMNPGQPLALG